VTIGPAKIRVHIHCLVIKHELNGISVKGTYHTIQRQFWIVISWNCTRGRILNTNPIVQKSVRWFL